MTDSRPGPIKRREIVQPETGKISSGDQYTSNSLRAFAEKNIEDQKIKEDFLNTVTDTQKDGICFVQAIMTTLGDRTIDEFTGGDFQSKILDVL